MKKLISIMLMGMMALSSIGVSATDLSYEVLYDYVNETATVKGNAAQENDRVVLLVLKKDVTLEEYYAADTKTKEGMILYWRIAAATGKAYDFMMDYAGNTSGNYEAVLVSSSDGVSVKLDPPLKLIAYAEFQQAYTELNTYAAAENPVQKTEFTDVINTKTASLDFDFSVMNKTALTEADVTNYYEYVKKNPLDQGEQKKNSGMFALFMTSEALNQTKLADINGYIDGIYFADTTLAPNFKKLAANTVTSEYFTQKMSGWNITTPEKFYESYKKALLLTAVKYGVGFGSAKELFSAYGSELGITRIASDGVFREMMGADYTSFEAMVQDYNRRIDTGTAAGGSSGGGGGGGGGGGYQMPAIGYPSEGTANTETKQPVQAEFFDIEGVEWAAEAILALADKGIIHGVEPGVFQPNENVTREQFVKILCGAMGYSPEAYQGNRFTDVRETDWFCEYVNVAAANGIVNGVGENLFGQGQNISREDMCVMLYRALCEVQENLPSGRLLFEDTAQISDYAKPAVETLSQMGVVNGVSNTMFDPKSFATRAQAAKIVYGVLDKLQ